MEHVDCVFFSLFFFLIFYRNRYETPQIFIIVHNFIGSTLSRDINDDKLLDFFNLILPLSLLKLKKNFLIKYKKESFLGETGTDFA